MSMPQVAGHSPLFLSQIHKAYQAKQVLQDISVELVSGEIFGLIGLNGAGKTTLIKIMLDLTQADAGDVLWFGQPAAQVEARRYLSYLPEKFQPSRYLKGSEYLSLSLAYYQMALDRDKARQWANLLDLDPDVLDQRVGRYSKGMGQKLGLLSAMLADRPVLLLDEPMSGLDPRARIRLKEALLAAKKEGKTIFFSSHILSDLDEICDRVAVLHEGVLRYIGSPAAFRDTQKTRSLEQAFLASIAG
jgi:ABC-2 type transport system ATP-binding protein